MIIFRVKINVAIYIEPRNGVKIFKKWVLGMSIFAQNLTRTPLRRKKLFSNIGFIVFKRTGFETSFQRNNR